MSEHKVKINWKRKGRDFSVENYDRTHQWEFGGGLKIKASSAPQYSGNSAFVNPEEALAVSLSSCHMLTFLAIAALKRLVVDSYEDHTVAVLDKNAQGKMAITKIYLRPKVEFSGTNIPDKDKIAQMHDKAHSHCFITNSVLCEVIIEPVFD